MVGRLDKQKMFSDALGGYTLQTETSPGGAFPWTPYLTPEPNVCLARRTTAHSGRPGAQPISSMVAFGPKEDVLLIGWAIWKLND